MSDIIEGLNKLRLTGYLHDVERRVVRDAIHEIERLRSLAVGANVGAEILQRLRDGIEEFESSIEDGEDRGERTDLWDHVIEVPVEDVRAILAALTVGAQVGTETAPLAE